MEFLIGTSPHRPCLPRHQPAYGRSGCHLQAEVLSCFAMNEAPQKPPIDQAREWIEEQYRKKRWACHLTEIGCLFWLGEDKRTTPGPLVDDGKPDEINLYTKSDDKLRAIAGSMTGTWPKLAGEFHVHPEKSSMVGLLPSPDDLLSLTMAVASDHWELKELAPPLDQLTDVMVSPSFSLILLLQLGQMWVIEAAPDRSPYSDLETQKKDIGGRLAEYEKWHRLADHRLGAVPQAANRDELTRLLSGELPAIQEFLQARCLVRLVTIED